MILAKSECENSDIPGFVDDIKDKICDKFSINITLGISSLKQSPLQMHEGYQEAEIAARQKFYLGNGRSIFYTDINAKEVLPISFNDSYEDLLANLEVGNGDNAEEALNNIFDLFTKSAVVQQQYIKIFCFRLMSDIYRILYDMNEKMESVFGEENIIWDKIYKFDTIPDISQWVRNIVNAVAGYIFSKRSRKNAHIVDMIVKIIEERYFEQITIDDIAKKVYLTPSYICHLFKENLGESIIDYLTRIRLKHAQKHLADPKLKIYEVAEQSGFNSTSYFSVVFKNAFGVNPKEYRNS